MDATRSLLRTLLLGMTLDSAPLLAAEPPAAPDAAPGAAGDPGGEDLRELDTVVVTGEKMGRKPRDTTASVAVRDGQGQQDMNDASPMDVLRRTGNALATDSGQFSLRGINSTGPEDGRQGFGQPLASVVVDGVVQDRIALTSGLGGSYDISQVEVLRGPQSTNLGRNALAGAIIVNTNNPSAYLEGGVRARISDDNTRQLDAMLNLPLTGNLAARLVVEDSASNGFITHVDASGEEDQAWAGSRGQMARLKLGLTDTADDAVRAVLTLQGRRHEQRGLSIYLEEPGTPAYTATADEPSRERRDSGLVALDVSFPLRGNLRLQSITAAMASHEDIHNDVDLGPDPNGSLDSRASGKTLTQELRLNWTGRDRTRASLGLYGAYINQPYVYDLVGDPVYMNGTAVAHADYTYRFDNRVTNKAVFAEWDQDFGRLLLTLGLRYDQESRAQLAPFTVSQVSPILLCPGPLCAIASQITQAFAGQAGLVPSAGSDEARATYSALLPKVALNYTLAPGLQAFASYTEGYRAGGAEILFSTGELNTYQPEYTRNYEIGWRFESADQRWQSALNLFHVDWRDQQVLTTSADGTDSITVNAANSTLDGGELELRMRPWPSLTLLGSLGYTHTAFKKFEKDGEDYAGDAFARSPRITGSVGAIWRHPAGGPMASANLSYIDRYYSTIRRNTRDWSAERYLLDARVGWEAERWSAYLFGRNLLDEEYTIYSARSVRYPGYPAGSRNVSYGEPLALGVEMEARY